MKVEITSKCGEILRSGPGIYAFSCSFCNAQFDSTKATFEHIENLHFNTTEEHCFESCTQKTSTEFPQQIFLNELKIEQEEEEGDENTKFNDIIPCVEYKENNLKIDNHPSAPVNTIGLHEDTMTLPDNSISVCPYCDKLFCSRNSLLNHIRQIHKPKQTTSSQLCFPCNKCNKTFDTLKDLLIHDKIHQENLSHKLIPLLECDICKKSVQNRGSMIRHMNKHIKPEYFCPKCDTKILSKSALTKHLMHHHTDSPHFRCVSCSKVFFDKIEYDQHLKQHQSSNVECPKCNKILTSRPKLKIHMRSIHKEEMQQNRSSKVECPKCNKLTSRPNINRHLQLVHGKNQKIPQGTPNFKCSFCEKSFFSLSNLKKHTLIHTDEKQYTCEVCGKMFRHPSNLVAHLRTHKGEKLFKCTICDKAFTQSSYVNIHMRVHTGERPFKCDLCSQSFDRCSRLTEHKRKSHLKLKPHKCQFCGQGFGNNTGKKEHERTHTGEKPYECDICLRLFARRKNLRQHLLVHSDKKPSYKCNYCDKTFTQISGKYGHERNIHMKEVVMN